MSNVETQQEQETQMKSYDYVLSAYCCVQLYETKIFDNILFIIIIVVILSLIKVTSLYISEVSSLMNTVRLQIWLKSIFVWKNLVQMHNSFIKLMAESGSSLAVY